MNIKYMGMKPDIKIVKEYIESTGNVFEDKNTLEEIEKFAVWIESKPSIATPVSQSDEEALALAINDARGLSITYSKYRHLFEAGCQHKASDLQQVLSQKDLLLKEKDKQIDFLHDAINELYERLG